MISPDIKGIRIDEQIGNGAGSIIFRGTELASGEAVVIKSVTPGLLDEIHKLAPADIVEQQDKYLKIYLAQVKNEARILRKIHAAAGGNFSGFPRVRRLVTVRNLFLLPVGVHLIEDLAPGESLRKNRNYNIEQFISIFRQSASILLYLHRQGYVHADMKPHHIIVNEGKVQIVDLGLACPHEGHASQVVGSPDYMSPEQLNGSGVDERTDVFGLGASMFWALTGKSIRASITGTSPLSAVAAGNNQYETSVRAHNANVPEALEDIVLRSCSPSRRARLNMSEVITRLDRLVSIPDRPPTTT